MPKHPATVDILVWLAQRDRTRSWLAWKAGISRSSLSQVMAGYSQPSPKLAKAIKRVTGIDLLAPKAESELTEAR